MLSSRRLQNTAALPEARAGSESAPLEEVVRLIESMCARLPMRLPEEFA
jgi:hypothetical protein